MIWKYCRRQCVALSDKNEDQHRATLPFHFPKVRATIRGAFIALHSAAAVRREDHRHFPQSNQHIANAIKSTRRAVNIPRLASRSQKEKTTDYNAQERIERVWVTSRLPQSHWSCFSLNWAASKNFSLNFHATPIRVEGICVRPPYTPIGFSPHAIYRHVRMIELNEESTNKGSIEK